MSTPSFSNSSCICLHKIKEREVFDSYKKNSSVDLNQEKQNRKREDRNLSSHVGILINKGWNGSKSIWAYIIGTLTVYIPALIWLSVFDFSWPEEGMLLSQGVYPFLIGDMIKAIIASLFTVGLTYSSFKNYLYKK